MVATSARTSVLVFGLAAVTWLARGLADEPGYSQRVLGDPGQYTLRHSAIEMSAQLARAPEIDLLKGADPMVLSSLSVEHPVFEEFDRRPDLKGMPVIRGPACQLSPVAASRLSKQSQVLRGIFSGWKSQSEQRALTAAQVNRDMRQIDLDADSPLLMQMLQCDDIPLRRALIQQLARSQDAKSSAALAQRCVYELDATLREEAVLLLKDRMTGAARQALLDTFRHPYAPFADHAATALVKARDREAIPVLLALLDAPDPVCPMPDADGQPVVREVVRINHARNCQLCHASSHEKTDPARVAVPNRDQPLPPAFSVEYYQPNDDRRQFVRADVTYLRQDFSLTLPVANPGPWPKQQRYDFFVRKRSPYAWELLKKDSGDYPQRFAVLRALRAITGHDFGTQTEAWRKGLHADRRFKL